MLYPELVNPFHMHLILILYEVHTIIMYSEETEAQGTRVTCPRPLRG